MIKTLTLVAGVAGGLVFGGSAFAVVSGPPDPTIGVSIGDEEIFNRSLQPNDVKDFEFNFGLSDATPPEDGEWSLILTGGGNIDPFHNLDVVGTDFGVSTDFAFSLVTPFLIPLTGVVEFSGSALVSARDSSVPRGPGAITSDVLLSGAFVDHVLFGSLPGEAIPVSLLFGDLAYAAFPDPGSSVGDSFGILVDCSLVFASGSCAAIGTFIGVGGNGGGDGFSVLSTLSVVEVPLPSALALVGVGLLGLGVVTRRAARG